MAEIDLKKAQRELDTMMKIMQAKEGEVNKYKSNFQTAYDDIKSLKEKLKGNITLIQAKDIVWNEIIEVIKTTWESLIIVSEEKRIVRDLQELVVVDKQKTLNRALWAKKFIDFINSKTYQVLEENEIKDRTLCVLEINKLIVKNACRNSVEKKLT